MGGLIMDERKGKPLLQVSREATGKQQEDAMSKVIDVNMKILAAAYDKAISYTQVVIMVGYGSFFAMWSFTRDSLSKRQVLWSAIFMSISIVTFVLFEVYQMYCRGKSLLSLQKALLARDTKDDLQKLEIRLDEHTAKMQTMTVSQGRYWLANVIVAVVTGLIAIVIIFYGFISALIRTYGGTS